VQELEISDIDTSQIQLLIGTNVKPVLKQLEVREGPDNLPSAIRTPLGWTIIGKYSVQITHVSVNLTRVNSRSDELSDQLQ
jgi:hypothetical protein